MLKEIYAENFALIDKLRQSFEEGFSVLTGETGAGKSVMIDAVALLMGGRFDQSLIRSGCEKCVVEGVFSAPYPAAALAVLREAGFELDADEDIILSREANRSGKSTSRINSRTVPLSLMRALGRSLINIHGQSEHTTLCEEEKQLALLDACGGDELLSVKDKVGEAWQLYSRLADEYVALQKTIADAAQKEDFLRFQIKELKNAHLQIGEDEELAATAQKLAHGERLLANAAESKELLKGNKGILENLDSVIHALRQIASLDNSMQETAEKLQGLYYELEDSSETIADYADSINFDPAYIEEVQNRLAGLERIKKKYRMDIPALCQYLQKCQNELESIDNSDELLQEKERQKEAAFAEFSRIAGILSRKRQECAGRLSEKISAELQALYMPEARFAIELPACAPGCNGMEGARFMLAANPGEPFAELARTASGGELSRVILAIKVITADEDGIPTLVFDEVDTGLGGGAVSAVAKKLALVAEKAQVLCVTHAPILAARADNHIHIYKHQEQGRTVIRTEDLSGSARIDEICRMLAGENITEQTVEQAKTMLAR